MEWIQYIANYLIIGTIVTFILDKANSNNPDPEMRFKNPERISLILFWPLAVLTFVYHFIKSMF